MIDVAFVCRRLSGLLTTGLLALALSACGSATDYTPAPPVDRPDSADGADHYLLANVSLTPLEQPRTKTGLIGHNYIDLSRPWLDWSGEPTGISHDRNARLLKIPAPAPDADMVLGMQRYDQFYGGRRYRLEASASNPDVAALIFLFDQHGEILEIPGLTGPLYAARDGAPLEFDAPIAAVGFFVQIQSAWQTTSAATLRPSVFDIGSVLGPQYINPRGPWTDWAGEAVAGIRYNALINQIWMDAPADGKGHLLGVQRITKPITAGSQYELAVRRGTKPGASLLLFLIDAQGAVIPFIDPDTGLNQRWLAVTAGADGQAKHFVAPAGVAEIRVQIQSPWDRDESSFIVPSLMLTDGDA